MRCCEVERHLLARKADDGAIFFDSRIRLTDLDHVEITAVDRKARRDDCRCARGQRVEQLGFCPDDALERADKLDMGWADRRDHSDIGMRKRSQLTDLAEPSHCKL